MELIKTGTQIQKTLKSASRLKTIVGVFAKHGFQNVLEKARLGRFFLEKFSNEEGTSKYSAAERVRMCFEELGPTFIKLGQLLSTRPDLIPPEFSNEFKKLQDNVQSLPFSEILKVLQNQLGGDEHKVFRNIVEQPLATASIAQVHMAQLHSGHEVVVKVRRPGIIKQINEDLNVLYTLASLVESSLPELRVYNPTQIVDEFFKTMELETNFVIEANNILRFQKNFENDPKIKIPKVYLEFSSEEILVMEMLEGYPLSQADQMQLQNVDRVGIAKKGIATFFKMVFQDRFFHGDLHAGNLFILPDNRIGLVDFGVVGRLGVKTRDAIANIFIALSKEDYEGMALEFADLSSSPGFIDVDLLTRDLRDLISPYFGLTFKNVNTGRILMDAAAIAAKHKAVVPAELMLFFKSIITIEGMGRQIVEDFDILEQTLVIAGEIIKTKYDPNRVIKDVTLLAKDSLSLLYDLPRYLRYSLKKWNQAENFKNVRLDQFDEFKRSLESSSNLLFLGIIMTGLLIAGSMALDQTTLPQLFRLPFISTICYGITVFLAMFATYHYWKK